jgi:hypothetical protein
MYEPDYLEGLELTEAEREGFRLADALMRLPPDEQLRVFWMFTGMHATCDSINEDLAECLRVVCG